MPAPQTDLESLAESFVSEDSPEAQNSRASAIAQHSPPEAIVEEETKKVIEAIGCENNCQTAKQAKFSKKKLAMSLLCGPSTCKPPSRLPPSVGESDKPLKKVKKQSQM